ncbi:MAG: VWA domain-containing protein [Deltaproteobacteria bacterium]|nr:VWA domain-containing protein [Deltaproteobacteria bacterium]
MSAPAKPPPEDDPLANAFPVRSALPAFLLSAAFHAGLLLALATISVTVAKQVRKINVKIVEPPAAVEDSDVDGAPALTDIAGQLRPVITQPRTAGSVAGPSAPAAVANVRAPDLPRIGVAPSVGAAPGSLDIPLSFGGSGLAGGGPGGSGFGDVLGSLRKVGVDLVLLIDTTNSMQSIIDDVKNQVRGFIADLQRMVPSSRVAVVAYRDKGDEYVTKWVDFSFKTDKVQAFVVNLRSDGGGDYPEAVYEAVDAAMTELSWRKIARRIMIIIGSSPPHPQTMPALLKLVRDLKEKNGAIGAIDVTKRLHDEYERADWVAHGSRGEFKPTPMPAFYQEVSDTYRVITSQGGGELIALGEEKSLLRQVMILTFGTRWRVEMAKYMGKLE